MSKTQTLVWFVLQTENLMKLYAEQFEGLLCNNGRFTSLRKWLQLINKYLKFSVLIPFLNSGLRKDIWICSLWVENSEILNKYLFMFRLNLRLRQLSCQFTLFFLSVFLFFHSIGVLIYVFGCPSSSCCMLWPSDMLLLLLICSLALLPHSVTSLCSSFYGN